MEKKGLKLKRETLARIPTQNEHLPGPPKTDSCTCIGNLDRK